MFDSNSPLGEAHRARVLADIRELSRVLDQRLIDARDRLAAANASAPNRENLPFGKRASADGLAALEAAFLR